MLFRNVFIAAGSSYSSVSAKTLAITPAMCGEDMEVPEKEAVPSLGVVEITFTPYMYDYSSVVIKILFLKA